MAIERTITPDMPPHATAGAYVETFARYHIYGRSAACFACPELGLFGYMGLDGLQRAILRVTGVSTVRSLVSYRVIEASLRG